MGRRANQFFAELLYFLPLCVLLPGIAKPLIPAQKDR